MVKSPEKVQAIDFERLAGARLRETLANIPSIRLENAVAEPSPGGFDRPDFVVPVRIADEPWLLICEFKRYSELRHVRGAALQLRHWLDSFHRDRRTYGVFVAPYVSPEAAAVLRSQQLGFMDLAGNCLLDFDHVHVERSGARNPYAVSRKPRSL